MRKDEVIEDFCRLSSKVSDHLGNQFAADCICKCVHNESYFQFEEQVMDFIREAVEEKISKESLEAVN